jgi:diguanylate cyclase (GGDEF)-like protein
MAEEDSLIQSYERRIYDLEQLLEISKSLNSNLDFGSTIQAILYACVGHMKALKAGVFVRSLASEDAYVFHRNHVGYTLDRDQDYRIDRSDPLIAYFDSRGGPSPLEEIRAEAPESPARSVLETLEPHIVAPLRAKGSLNGLLVLGEPMEGADLDKPTESDASFLKTVTILAGLAIHNSFLYEVGTTDMMTRLKLKHFFLDRLRRELEGAAAGARDLSIVVMDVDNFKKTNDTYGHVCGDHVLVRVADILLSNIRQTDTAARFGGDELTILLPGANLTEAVMTAERIREGISAEAVFCAQERVLTTVSIGVAQYNPQLDETVEALLDRADLALYRSKQQGRNQVSTAP